MREGNVKMALTWIFGLCPEYRYWKTLCVFIDVCICMLNK